MEVLNICDERYGPELLDGVALGGGTNITLRREKLDQMSIFRFQHFRQHSEGHFLKNRHFQLIINFSSNGDFFNNVDITVTIYTRFRKCDENSLFL